MKKIEKLKKELELNKKEIENLQSFRPTKQTKQFLRHLFGEHSFLQSKLRKLQSSKQEDQRSKEARLETANKKRSDKMKRSWRYFRAIQENYPVKLSSKEIRSEFSKFRKGLETDVSEIMWRNPSP